MAGLVPVIHTQKRGNTCRKYNSLISAFEESIQNKQNVVHKVCHNIICLGLCHNDP
jgi:hypothetical protein